MKINWTRTAQAHLDSIYNYISKDSTSYAKKVIDRITLRSI
jgi:toxin ParE1/3/4